MSRTLPVAVALFLALAAILLVSGRSLYFQTPQPELGDVAVNAIQIENARHFRELHGNYSRFEFNHPGPAFFYAYALAETLFHRLLPLCPAPANAHLLGGMLLQTLFLAGALGVLAAHLRGRLWLGAALVAAAVHYGTLPAAIKSIWPPHVLLLPFLAFLVASASVASGRAASLPWLVLSGGFLFHGHVAQTAYVGGLGILSLAMLGWRIWNSENGRVGPSIGRPERQPTPKIPGPNSEVKGQNPGTSGGALALSPTLPFSLLQANRRPLFLSAFLSALFILPIALDLLLYGREGNIATILGFFNRNASDGKSLLQSILYFVSFSIPAADHDATFTTLGPASRQFLAAHPIRILCWFLVFTVPPLAAWLRRSRLEPDSRAFLAAGYAMLAAAVALSLVWGMAQTGEMVRFNSYFYGSIYFAALLLLIAVADGFSRSQRSVALRSLGAGGSAALAACLFFFFFRSPSGAGPDPAVRIRAQVAAALAASPADAPIHLSLEHRHWPVGSAVALELERLGRPYYLDPWWGFMFGRRHESLSPPAPPPGRLFSWWITGLEPGGEILEEGTQLHAAPGRMNPGGGFIDFAQEGNLFRYLVQGVSLGNITFANITAPHALWRFAPAPAERDVLLTFDIERNAPGQTAEVYFNGSLLGRIAGPATRARASVAIPRALWNGSPTAELEIKFPGAQPTRKYWRPRYPWWIGWKIWRIEFELQR